MDNCRLRLKFFQDEDFRLESSFGFSSAEEGAETLAAKGMTVEGAVSKGTGAVTGAAEAMLTSAGVAHGEGRGAGTGADGGALSSSFIRGLGKNMTGEVIIAQPPVPVSSLLDRRWLRHGNQASL